jgi:hypothetical protein
MKFDLRAPCGNCPFRTDITFYLDTARVEGICKAITTGDKTFSCHKTTKHDDEGRSIAHKGEQHCGGALVMLERLNRPNQMMRIAERLRYYDRSKLRMDAPVFESTAAMIGHYKALNKGK